MNVVFVGGGSFRTLPIVRAAMADQRIASHATISLIVNNHAKVRALGVCGGFISTVWV